MLNVRRGCFVTAYEGKLYMVGGTFGDQIMEIYDPQTNLWSDAKIPTKAFNGHHSIGCTFSSKFVHQN